MELKFHGMSAGIEQGFHGQTDLGPARLSGTDAAPLPQSVSVPQVCEQGGQGPSVTPMQHTSGPGVPRNLFQVTIVPCRDWEEDRWASSKDTRDG